MLECWDKGKYWDAGITDNAGMLGSWNAGIKANTGMLELKRGV